MASDGKIEVLTATVSARQLIVFDQHVIGRVVRVCGEGIVFRLSPAAGVSLWVGKHKLRPRNNSFLRREDKVVVKDGSNQFVMSVKPGPQFWQANVCLDPLDPMIASC